LVGRLLLAGTVLLAPLAMAGDGDNIVTDRPDFVESSNVVGKGRFQIETSFALERNNANGLRDRVTSMPSLIRIGLTDNVELRVETDGPTVARSSSIASGQSQTRRGMADLSIGAKWHVADASGSSPSLGLLAHLDLPSGAAPFRGDGVRPSLRLAAEWELPAELSFGVMPGLIVDRDAQGRRFAGAIFGIVVGKSWNEQLRTFIEVAMPQITRAEHGGTQATLDVGTAFLISKRVQVDAALSRGLNNNTADLSWTVGLSVKY
jgi:hypothetical protein